MTFVPYLGSIDKKNRLYKTNFYLQYLLQFLEYVYISSFFLFSICLSTLTSKLNRIQIYNTFKCIQ